VRLDNDDGANLSRAFAQADADSSSSLQYKEFLKTVDLVDGRMAQRFFELADKDGSGSLDFNEFATTLATANNLSDQQRLEWTYKLFDRDKNGQLEVQEVFKALNDPNVNLTFPKQRLKSIFTKMCKDPNKITQEEFCAIAKVQPLLEMPFRMLHAKIVAFVLDFNPETEGESAHREFAVNCPEGGALLPVGHTADKYVVARGDTNKRRKSLSQKQQNSEQKEAEKEARRLSHGRQIDEEEAARIAAIAVKETRYITYRLVVHGETAWNVEQKVLGQTDVALNDKGRAQAKAIATVLSADPVDAIITCGMSRCADTAREIHAQQKDAQFLKHNGITAVNQGTFTGLRNDDPQYLKLHEALEAKKKSFSDKHVSQGLCYPGGETDGQVVARAMHALVEMADCGSNIIAVCGAHVIKDLAWEMSGLSYKDYMLMVEQSVGQDADAREHDTVADSPVYGQQKMRFVAVQCCCVMTAQYEAVGGTWEILNPFENFLTGDLSC